MSTGNIIIEKNVSPGFYGLVVSGGKSSRMGTDKGMLRYYDEPQRYHVYNMLDPFCEKVFISCNPEQAVNIPLSFPSLTDLPEYRSIGPMAAILTAFHHFPGKDFMVMGCDYPFFKDKDIADLLASVENNRTTVFYNAQEELYEPLLGYYSHTDGTLLNEIFAQKEYSLQYFLRKINAGKFYPRNIKSITSIDTREEFLAIKRSTSFN